MRSEEAFVARSLVAFLGGSERVAASKGIDPPDLLLTIGESSVGVEVTRLSPFTVYPSGSIGNRTTDDICGSRLIDDLDVRLGPLLPEDVNLTITLKMPVSKGSRFRLNLTSWVCQIANSAVLDARHESTIEGVKTCISVVPRRHSKKRIVGIVGNAHSFPDVGFNVRFLLEDRIRTKSEICAQLPKPVWLALLNDYWLADAQAYANAFKELALDHCFERVFLVASSGEVTELC